MKTFLFLGLFCVNFQGYSETCRASPDYCPQTCVAVAPSGGSVDCYEDTSFAECEAFDSNGSLVEQETVWCGSTSGSGGVDCSIYWWYCDPWSL